MRHSLMYIVSSYLFSFLQYEGIDRIGWSKTAKWGNPIVHMEAPPIVGSPLDIHSKTSKESTQKVPPRLVQHPYVGPGTVGVALRPRMGSVDQVSQFVTPERRSPGSKMQPWECRSRKGTKGVSNKWSAVFGVLPIQTFLSSSHSMRTLSRNP